MERDPLLATVPNAIDSTWFVPALMAAGVVGIGVVMTISIRSKIARKNAGRPTGRAQIDQIKRDRANRNDMHAATAEMLDLSRRLAAQLDDKAERLEQLMAEADLKVLALEAGMDPDTPVVGASVPSIAPPDSVPSPAATSPQAGAPRGSGSSIDPLAQSVYELSDTGQPPVQIARQLNEHIGKIELILALRAR